MASVGKNNYYIQGCIRKFMLTGGKTKLSFQEGQQVSVQSTLSMCNMLILGESVGTPPGKFKKMGVVRLQILHDMPRKLFSVIKEAIHQHCFVYI